MSPMGERESEGWGREIAINVKVHPQHEYEAQGIDMLGLKCVFVYMGSVLLVFV